MSISYLKDAVVSSMSEEEVTNQGSRRVGRRRRVSLGM